MNEIKLPVRIKKEMEVVGVYDIHDADAIVSALNAQPHGNAMADGIVEFYAAMEAGLKDFIRIGRNVQSIRADRDQKAAMKRNLFEAVARWRNALRP